MVVDLIDQPDLFYGHLRRYANSLTTQMIFGVRTLSLEDPNMVQLFRQLDQFSRVMGTASAAFLDLFPVLRRLPDFMLPARAHAKELHKQERVLFYERYQTTKDKIRKGTAMVRLHYALWALDVSDVWTAAMLLCRSGQGTGSIWTARRGSRLVRSLHF